MRWLLIAPLMLLLILFGLSNRQEVSFTLWPLDLTWAAPLSIAVMAVAAIAFLFGALVTWTAALQYRRRARRLEEAARVLEAELAEARGRLARDVAPPPQRPGASVLRLARPAA